MPERSSRKRNLWVLLPKARPKALGLTLQPPPEALYWTLEGDPCWHPMPAAPLPPPPTPAAPDQRQAHQTSLWPQPDPVEPWRAAAKPFLRYPGGKTYLLKELGLLLAGFPCEQYDYLEPMVGGAAVFWAFGPRFRTRVIGDKGGDLVTLYRILRNDVEGLIRVLGSGAYEYLGKHDPASLALFRHLLATEPTDPLLRAARYLFLNRACWGGMLRVHRGRLKASPNLGPARICDPSRLRACAAALQGVQILRGSAHQVIMQARAAHPERNFLLLVDPPYDDPAKKFREYSGTFTRRDQAELVKAVLESGYKFLYTNKATDYIRGLFADAPGVTRITLPLRHKLGTKGPPETELLVYNLAHPV